MSEKIKKAAMGISLLLSCTLPLSEMFAEELSFRARKDFAVGFQPMSIMSGDFNGDAVLDLAVANIGSATDPGSVSILIGNGDGTFQAPFAIQARPRPRTLAVGDFNEDGILDLAVAYEHGGRLSIHLGDGVGGFRFLQDFAVVGDTVATSDFNKDGHLDLLVGDRSISRTISVFLGNGNGTFATATDTYVGGELNAVAMGDFNNDGIPDLVIGHGYGYSFITLLLGDGDGRFQTARSLLGYGARSVVAADFNGDNNLDIVTEQALLLGRGDGTFTLAAVFLVDLTDVPSFTVAVGDFNGDGHLDVALTTQLYRVYILLGNGDGTFQPPTRITVGPAPRSILSGDFNGDGYLDLVVANTNFVDFRLGTISVMLGSGDGHFSEAEALTTGYNAALLAGDFNQDGRLDVAVVSYASLSLSGTVRIFLGDGTGHFQGPRSFSVGGDVPTAAALGDFNGDGALDLATANEYSGDVSILLGQGDGSFQPARPFRVGDRPSAIAAEDFNGDQVLDLAVVHSGRVSIFLGQGDGGFQAASYSLLPGASAGVMLVADFNGDAIRDLAVAYRNARVVSILLGNGDGRFQAARDFPVIGVNLEGSLAVADINGDGLLDLVVGGSGSVSILMGNGDGTFQAARSLAVGFGPNSPTLGDFNRDGILDLAVSNRVLGNVSLLSGNGDGTFRFIQDFGVAEESILSIVGDFNRDDRQDLIVLNFEHITILLNDTIKP